MILITTTNYKSPPRETVAGFFCFAAMDIRRAQTSDAEEACVVIRRSINERCVADHHGDDPTITSWMANKTADNMRRWIDQSQVFVAVEGEQVIGVGAITQSGTITLNYVLPEARFRGVSKALLRWLEAEAVQLGIRTVTVESTATALQFYRSLGYCSDSRQPLPMGRPCAIR